MPMKNEEEQLPAGVKQGFFDTILSPFKTLFETWKTMWRMMGVLSLVLGLGLVGYGGYKMYQQRSAPAAPMGMMRQQSWRHQPLRQHVDGGMHMHGMNDSW